MAEQPINGYSHPPDDPKSPLPNGMFGNPSHNNGANGQLWKTPPPQRRRLNQSPADITRDEIAIIVRTELARQQAAIELRVDGVLKKINEQFGAACDEISRKLTQVLPERCNAASAILSLIHGIETVDRALARIEACGPEELFFHPESMMTLQVVRQDLLVELANQGIEAFGANVGDLFDSSIHRPLAWVPTSDNQNDGRIAELLSPGYRYGCDQRIVVKAIINVFGTKNLSNKEKH